MTSYRLLPEQLKVAYLETGLKPIREYWADGYGGADGLSAYAKTFAKNKSIKWHEMRDILTDVAGLTRPYIDGYGLGFDELGGLLKRFIHYYDSDYILLGLDREAAWEEFKVGYQDGLEGWKAVNSKD